MGLASTLDKFEKRLRKKYNVDPSVPGNERKAHIYNLYFDHAFLRTLWTNFFEIAPAVYRSNHPTHARFEAMRDMGIVSVLNLRGASHTAHYLTEKKSCDDLGLKLKSAALSARSAPSRSHIQAVLEAFRTIEKPFVMHCKSGADRAGLASAMYLMVIEGQPLSEARKMLHWRYLHVRSTATGVLDYILDCFEARQSRGEISFEDWINTEYDADAINKAFKSKQPAQ